MLGIRRRAVKDTKSLLKAQEKAASTVARWIDKEEKSHDDKTDPEEEVVVTESVSVFDDE